MSDRVECFWIQPTALVRRALRRYAGESRCELGHGYHNAATPLGDFDSPASAREPTPDFARDDPRWPVACPCGYAFDAADRWQVFEDRVYERPDTLERMVLRDAPPGAMYDGEWYKPTWQGPDGLALVVILPDLSPWLIDGPARDDRRPWTRTGTPPKITATPSIQTPRYHGHLRDGFLVSC